jgi:hypothetical protein
MQRTRCYAGLQAATSADHRTLPGSLSYPRWRLSPHEPCLHLLQRTHALVRRASVDFHLLQFTLVWSVSITCCHPWLPSTCLQAQRTLVSSAVCTTCYHQWVPGRAVRGPNRSDLRRLILPFIADSGMLLALQTNHYEGVLAGAVADAVVEHLISMKRLPESFRSTDVLSMSRVMLNRPSKLKVVGRSGELESVMEGLTGDAGAAVLVGGPGDGKTTLAMEAGLELCKRGWFPGGAYVIDFHGALD